MTIGVREVEFKRRRWGERHVHRAADYLKTHRLPVVVGPNLRHHLIDRHHLALALQQEGVWEIPVSIIADMSALNQDAFWTVLEHRGWSHPFDDEGRRRSYKGMPQNLEDLVDDPYRSLAGALKRAGGYAKDEAPFSEFSWADFLRGRIPRKLVEGHFGRALVLATNLAHSPDAASLPGWRRYPQDVEVILDSPGVQADYYANFIRNSAGFSSKS